MRDQITHPTHSKEVIDRALRILERDGHMDRHTGAYKVFDPENPPTYNTDTGGRPRTRDSIKRVNLSATISPPTMAWLQQHATYETVGRLLDRLIADVKQTDWK